MIAKFFLHATNVHSGGGAALLAALLENLPVNMTVIAVLDSRMALPKEVAESTVIKRVRPTVLERVKAEKWLADNAGVNDTTLCFGNLPPLFKLRGRVVVFLQNRYLIDGLPLSRFARGVRARLMIERMWLAKRISNAHVFVVQTPTMKVLLEKRLRPNRPVSILPFLDTTCSYSRRVSTMTATSSICDKFIYVASGEPFKNHINLIRAWCVLAAEGLYPTLLLTFDAAIYHELDRFISELRLQHDVRVTNLGRLPRAEVLSLYRRVAALIYPSTVESLGLPLIEARQAGLPLLASELDYVRDVVDPEQTFDPQSPVSIARAVKRFLGVDEAPLPLLDAGRFIEHIIGIASHAGRRAQT